MVVPLQPDGTRQNASSYIAICCTECGAVLGVLDAEPAGVLRKIDATASAMMGQLRNAISRGAGIT